MDKQTSKDGFVEAEVKEKVITDYVLSARHDDGTQTAILYVTPSGRIDMDSELPARPMAEALLRGFQTYLQTHVDSVSTDACNAVVRHVEEERSEVLGELERIEYFVYFAGAVNLILVIVLIAHIALTRLRPPARRGPFDDLDFRDMNFD